MTDGLPGKPAGSAGRSAARLLELDALRGIAALAVVLFHFTMGRPQAQMGFKLGITGVDLFFMISGFVIFMTINRISRGKEFIVSRVTRLYPAYWCCVTITFGLILFSKRFYFHEPIDIGADSFRYLVNLTMLQQFASVPHLDGTYWTLTVELLFYVCIYVLFKLKLLGRIYSIGLVCVLLTLLYQTALIRAAPGLYGFLHRYFPLINHFPLFFAGIIFYNAYQGFDRLSRSWSAAFLVLCFAVQTLLYHKAGRDLQITRFEYVAMLAVYFAVFTLFVSGKLGFIVARPTVYLGTLSYSLYLIHQFLSVGILLPGMMKVLGWSFWLAAPVTLAIVLALAGVITAVVEKPGRKLMKKWLSPDPPDIAGAGRGSGYSSKAARNA